MTPRVYTYDAGESGKIEAWGISWAAAGFEPIVLNRSHSENHPEYKRFRYSLNVINKFIFGRALTQEAEEDWTKWLAFAGVKDFGGRFLVSDINHPGFCHAFLPEGLTFWNNDRLVSGSAMDFLLFCKAVKGIDQFAFSEFIKSTNRKFDVSAFLQARRIGNYADGARYYFGNMFLEGVSSIARIENKPCLNRRPVPVFMHIPRCGGTYVFGCMSLFARCYAGAYGRTQGEPRNAILFYDVYEGGEVVFRVIAIANDNKNGHRHNRIKFDDFVSALERSDFGLIFSIIIEPHGVKIYSKIISWVLSAGLKPVCFGSLRSSWSWANSMFEYLANSFSRHEVTHKYVGDSIEDYIKSDLFSDSWLVRNLLNISDLDAVTLEFADLAAMGLLQAGWRFCDIKKIDQLLGFVFEECYEISFSQIPKNWIMEISKNEANAVDRNIGSLPLDAKEIFLFKTKSNTILYEKLVGGGG